MKSLANTDTKILALGACALLLSFVACDSRAVSSGGDGAVEADAGPTGPTNVPNPSTPTTSGCQRPEGMCLTDGDCPADATCIRSAKTTYDDPSCTVDPCCDAGDDGARKRPTPGDGDGYDPAPPPDGEEREPFVVPPCVDCLGRCALRPCTQSAECGAGSFCDLGFGCKGEGVCRPRPVACDANKRAPEPPSPDGGSGDWASPEYPGPGVCGCDGQHYPSACEANVAGTSVNNDGYCGTPQQPGPDPDCADIACAVKNTCCECVAYDPTVSNDAAPKPGPCPSYCEVPMCEAVFGLPNPKAYCVAGQCLLTDTSTTCQSDGDCKLVDDCCSCAAVPTGVKAPECLADCFVSRCTSLGLAGKVAPRCVKGICKLVRL